MARESAAPQGRAGRRLRRRAVPAIAAGALAAIVAPKCPLCVGAYAASFGVGAAATWLGWVRPLGLLLAAAGLLYGLLCYARTRRRV